MKYFFACLALIFLMVTSAVAQTLPVTKTLAWDANAPTDNVINYTVRLNGVVVGNPTGTTQVVVFTTWGNQTLTVTATNATGISPAATLIYNNVAPPMPPAAPTGLRVL